MKVHLASTTAQRDFRNVRLWFAFLMVASLVVRLLFIGNEGFKTDINTYAAWALSLSAHGFASFYSSVGFADYPPGYFYVLAIVGRLWHAFFASHDAGYAILRLLVKLPAILADLGVGLLLYAIARRFAGAAVAIGVAAFYLFNPATIYISASWGQVDSISGGLALLAIYALLRSEDAAPQSRAHLAWIVLAWLSFAYSLLIKPQAAVLLPLLIAFAFVDPLRRRERVVATAIGVAAALAFALLITEPFHPSNPVAAFTWLWNQYAYGSAVYQYNTVNAFNLWALRGTMWVSDNQYILGLPQFAWGLLLVVAALALIVWRYVQDRTSAALLEGCAIATLAFFVLATRMHERYLFNGLLFTVACIPFARRYFWGAIALSIVLFSNLLYSLQYLHAVTSSTPGVNAQNLWGLWTTLLSLLAVGTFFVLGYQFLGGPELRPAKPSTSPEPASEPQTGAVILPALRHWFDPREGLTAMRAPLDYAIVAALGVGNFILSFIGYWWPPDKVFDEIYFARAGEEYLQNLRIYENTHPPLTKLLITLSMMLFGGMPHGHGLGGWTGLNALIGHMPNGDNSYGWRFLDVVFGALVVMLLYVFAKRITGSTLFATITALLLTFDGMHFVQSRIATPEGFVVFFATLAVYAFYRFWINSQVGERAHVTVPTWAFLAVLLMSFGVATIIAQLFRIFLSLDAASTTIVTLYVGLLFYLLIRYFVVTKQFGDGRRQLTYAEGSYALRGADGTALFAVDGGTIDARGKIARGLISQPKGGGLVYDDAPLRIEYRRNASVAYQTPCGEAVYADDEVRAAGVVENGRSSKLWLILFTVALGLLVSSKWYGVMGFGVSFVIIVLVWLQRYLSAQRPTLWGNPRGFRLDTALMTIILVSMTVYALVWVPDLVRRSPDPNEIHNLNDVVYRQYSMFEYHDVGVAHATHPYSSKWWEWPLDYVPVAYFYQDHRNNPSDEKGCCVSEITTMPNPFILWFGLFSVPFVGVLAVRLRNKGYALIVITYLLQWLPWIGSPRITFAYHFYVNIPLICLCNAITLQHLWTWAKSARIQYGAAFSVLSIGAYLAIVVGAFLYFYPVLSAHPLAWDAWHRRMWIDKWIIGPG